MKKSAVIILFVIVIAVFLAIGVANKDNIVNYFNNKEWELVESIGTVRVNNYYTVDGTTTNLLVVGNNYVTGYSDTVKEVFDESVSLKSAITNTNGDYCIVGEKGGTKIYLLNSSTKLWESEIQGDILGVSVNKNGYSSVIYKQTGYKSLIKILAPDGTELFTSYLASTYAIDTQISNDNKKLAIAEINAEGINVQCSIRLIDINNVNQENITKISLGSDILVTDIEYNDKNQLLVLTDSSAIVINDDVPNTIVENFDNSICFATIENANDVVLISKVENGLFDISYEVNIYAYKEGTVHTSTYPLKVLPSMISAGTKYIALLLENELVIINTSGRLVKHCMISGNVKEVKFFGNGSVLALVYRDKIEFLKI
ncbi:MAG: hypothetical protein IJ215_00890 [Clostridia bacterium]|nr:hypothetical protein [Clostridia bacterium]